MQFAKRIVSSFCFAVGYAVGAFLISMTNALNAGFEAAERRYANPVKQSFTFPRSKRLHGKLTFRAVYEDGRKDARGPLVTFSLPNDLNYPRMGLSVSRRVGTAPRRNQIKRKLRESFRLLQHDWPRGYDLVVVVRPHEPLTLAEYQKLLSSAMVRIHHAWSKK